MPVTIGGGLTFCGRELKPEELDVIRQITREFSTLSLTELAHTVCELLEWRRPNGGLKSRECYLFLLALHRRGWLPDRKSTRLNSSHANISYAVFCLKKSSEFWTSSASRAIPRPRAATPCTSTSPWSRSIASRSRGRSPNFFFEWRRAMSHPSSPPPACCRS